MPVIRNCASCGSPNRIPAKHLSDIGKCGACKATLPAVGEPIEVNEEEFREIIPESKVPVLMFRSIPNFAVFSGDQLQFQQAGLVHAATMESWLTRAAA